MVEQIKKKLKKHWITVGVVLILVGIAAGIGVFWTYLPIGPVQHLNYMPGNEIHEGKAVIYVTYAHDYFSYFTDEYDNEVMRQYIIPVGDENSNEWMGIQLSGKRMQRMNNNMEAYWNWVDSGSTDEDELWSSMDYFMVRGTVKLMDDESMDYYADYLDNSGITADEVQYFLPYIFEPATPFNDQEASTGTKAAGYIFVLGLIGVGIGVLVYALRGSFLKDYKKYVNKVGSNEEADFRIEKCMTGTPMKGVYIDDSVLVYSTKNTFCVVDAKDVIWIYQYILTRKSGLITVGKDYSVKIKKVDGTEINVPCKKNEINMLISFIMQKMPDIIVGYSDELSKLYSKDRASFVREIDKRRNERTGAAAGTNAMQPNVAAGTDTEFAATSADVPDLTSANEQEAIDRAYAEAMANREQSSQAYEEPDDDDYDASVYDEPEEDIDDDEKPSDGFNFFD